MKKIMPILILTLLLIPLLNLQKVKADTISPTNIFQSSGLVNCISILNIDKYPDYFFFFNDSFTQTQLITDSSCISIYKLAQNFHIIAVKKTDVANYTETELKDSIPDNFLEPDQTIQGQLKTMGLDSTFINYTVPLSKQLISSDLNVQSPTVIFNLFSFNATYSIDSLDTQNQTVNISGPNLQQQLNNWVIVVVLCCCCISLIALITIIAIIINKSKRRK